MFTASSDCRCVLCIYALCIVFIMSVKHLNTISAFSRGRTSFARMDVILIDICLWWFSVGLSIFPILTSSDDVKRGS